MSEIMLERFLQKTRRAVALRGRVNVLVTTSRELQSLNLRFRGRDIATDVLSFPAFSNLAQDFAGDIAISADIAARNAKRFGHSTGEEVKILMLHGVLHLAGYDHERDNGTMAGNEQRLRQKLGLPVALIERTGGKERGDRDPSASLRARSPAPGGRVARRHTAMAKTSPTRRKR